MRCCSFALSLALVALFAVSAEAQLPIPPAMYGGVPALMDQPLVHEELRLNRKQVGRAGKLLQGVQRGRQKEFANLEQAVPAQRWEKTIAFVQSVSDESYAALKEVLDAEQLKRLKQLDLQFRGPRALRDAGVQAQLKLSAEQQEKFQTLASDARRESTDIMQDATLNRPFKMQKIRLLRMQMFEKIIGVLTDEQKQTWREMLGEPFVYQTAIDPSARRPRAERYDRKMGRQKN